MEAIIDSALTTLKAYRALNTVDSDLVKTVAGLIIASAQNGLTSVDSAVLLEALNEHHRLIKQINMDFLGK